MLISIFEIPSRMMNSRVVSIFIGRTAESLREADCGDSGTISDTLKAYIILERSGVISYSLSISFRIFIPLLPIARHLPR